MTLTKEECRQIIAKRAAKELKSGDVVTLGIGLPTEIANYIPDDIEVIIHSENGMLGIGAKDDSQNEFLRITNAGGLPVTATEGAAFFDTALSFTMIRGGHVDATVLGAMEVDQEGNLANWSVPSKMIAGMGGAMDLVVGAKKVIVAMEHTAKNEPRIVKKCTLPLTAAHEVDLIITERAVIKVTPKGLLLKEINPAFSLDEVIKSTGADLIIAPELLQKAC